MHQTLKRNIFWHEVGHYCAQQLNKHYGKYGNREIKLIRSQQSGITRYQGNATQNTPPNFDPESKEIRHPASMIGSLVYGCIFQCSFLNENFDACFGEEMNGVNGFDDYNRTWDVADRFGLNREEKVKLSSLILAHFDTATRHIKDSKILEIDIRNLIEGNECVTTITSGQLDQLFNEFLSSHRIIYNNFVGELEALFKDKKQ